MGSGGLLVSEPSIAETAVWCILAKGIDPSEWAYLGFWLALREIYPATQEITGVGLMEENC